MSQFRKVLSACAGSLSGTKAVWVAGLVIFSMIFVTSCATPYQAEGLRGGFTETKLSENTYRVTFSGSYATDTQQVIDYALLRSTELALISGYTFLSVEEADTSIQTLNVERPAALVSVTANPGSFHAWVDIREEQMSVYRKPTVTLVVRLLHEPIGETIFNCSELQQSLARKYGLDSLYPPREQ